MRGITLLEIITALLILAFAFIPIVGILTTGVSETDITNSYTFAQTLARSILENILENLPFESISVSTSQVSDIGGTNPESEVAIFSNTPNYNIASFLQLIGNSIDNYGRGMVTDNRGTDYHIKIFVFPVEGSDSNIPNTNTEVTFTYLPRPQFENQIQAGKLIWYTSDEFVPLSAQRPYDYDISAITLNAKNIGIGEGSSAEKFCLFKKILLRIRWNMPAQRTNYLELYTVKGRVK